MLLQGIIVVFALRYGIVAGGDTRWTSLMDLVRVECGEPGVNQDEIPFVGFKDECDNEEIAPYKPVDSAAHLDFVIDPRNADDIQWDTARYKRYGTYWPNANITWHVPGGFTNLWARVYYADDNDIKYGAMEYQYSEDGVTFYDVPNVERGLDMECTVASGGCWYRKKVERSNWTQPMRYLKAIWPPPCRGEVGARYAADERRCLSLPPPGWAGTVDEFDASPLKDLYFTPQLGEIILGTSDHTPGRPTNLHLTPARTSVLVTWAAPDSTVAPITGYTVYYQVESTLLAVEDTYRPPYLARRVNVGNVNAVVLSGLTDTARLVIVRVAASNAYGSGPSTSNVWVRPFANGTAATCPPRVPRQSSRRPSPSSRQPAANATAEGVSTHDTEQAVQGASPAFQRSPTAAAVALAIVAIVFGMA